MLRLEKLLLQIRTWNSRRCNIDVANELIKCSSRTHAVVSLRPSLIRPRHWQVLCAVVAKLIPSGSSPLRIRSTISGDERSKPQNSADVRAIDTVGRRQVLEAGVFAGLELLLPTIRLGHGGDERAVGFAFGRDLAVVALGEHHLAAVATMESDRDSHDDHFAVAEDGPSWVFLLLVVLDLRRSFFRFLSAPVLRPPARSRWCGSESRWFVSRR